MSRRVIIRLSDEAYESFQRLAREGGVTLTALIQEAAALGVERVRCDPEARQILLRRARGVDADRRRRSATDPG